MVKRDPAVLNRRFKESEIYPPELGMKETQRIALRAARGFPRCCTWPSKFQDLATT